MGKKGESTTNVQSYTPTAQEIRLQEQAANYADAVSPNALKLNNIAGDLLYGSYGAVQTDYNALANKALSEQNKTLSGINDLTNSFQNQAGNIQSGVNNLTNGQLPQAYLDNMQQAIQSGVDNSVGQVVNNLGQRGVLNSSVTTKAMDDISKNAANAMAQQYQNNIGLLSGLYGQQSGDLLNNASTLSGLYGQQLAGATSPISTAAAAQEAAQNPALNLWNASLGLNSGGTLGALNAVSGQGTTTSTQKTSGGSGLFGGVLTGLAGNSSLFCFTEETLIKTPTGDKRIDDIKVDDIVICPNTNGMDSEERVFEVMDPHYNDVYTISCNDGKYVNTTLTQPLLNNDCEFVLVSDICIGDVLKNAGKVISIIYNGKCKVYDIKLTGENNYYANGFIAKGGSNEWGDN